LQNYKVNDFTYNNIMILMPWSGGFLNLDINNSPAVNRLEPVYPPPLPFTDIRTAVENDMAILAQSIKQVARVVLILEDPSRPSETRGLVEIIAEKIKEIRGGWAGFHLVIAAGAHYKIAPRHLQKKVPRLTLPIIIHDSRAESSLESLGISRSGIPLFFNQTVVQAELRLSISTVNIHPLAGFSGGGKILLPGVAGLETIFGLHHLPPGKAGIHHSAMWELTDEVLKRIPIDYSWHLISRPDGALVKICSGHVVRSHTQAKQSLLNLVSCPRPVRKPNLLLLGCKPFDQNLIGTFKSLTQIPPLLKSQGYAILFNEAPQGTGYHHWRNDPQIIAAQKNHYQNLLQDFQVAVYSPHATPVQFQNLFPAGFDRLTSETQLTEFIAKIPTEAVTVLPYAPITLVEG
jgi:nickel-dependent lactate racemase